MTRRLVVSLILLAGLAPAAAFAQTKIDARKVVEGVWASPTPGGSNVGWFLLGDGVIAVDAGVSEEVGRSLVEEIQKTTGKKPRYLIVTHAHRDHAGGAAAFAAAGAQIICSEKAAPGLLFLLDAAARADAGKAASPKPAGTPVVLTVSERSLFVGGQSRRAEIYYLGPGHTQGDLVIVLPTDGILFSGDLAVNGVLPFVRSSDVDPKGWQRLLPRLAALKIEKMVPGHGAIGPREGIADTAAYISRVNEIVTRLLLTNPSDTMIDAQLRAPENTIENVKITPDHVANVKAVYQLAKAEHDKPAPSPTATPQPR
jgi:glyoxylase-like metal-dependent hydrolase (beta-lactamase superfamily II)